MKRILPLLPLFTLIIGVFLVQANQYNTGAILSSVLTGKESTETVKICTKPEAFSEKNESAWCQMGLVADIVEKNTDWSWTCIVDTNKHFCHFSDTKTYRTRGGILFGK